MKLWIPLLTLLLAVSGVIIWDTINTNTIFNHMQKESTEISTALSSTDISNKDLQDKINSLNAYWTKEMDVLSLFISRKDLQPVSDYLQYLTASATNKSQEDAITYSGLLKYNIDGLKESNSITLSNLI